LAFVFGRLIKYRRKVVKENIANSFPEKADNEIEKLVNGFYLHLADLMIEIIKAQGLPFRWLKKSLEIENMDLLNSLYDDGKGVLLMSGHLGNWEIQSLLPKYGMKHNLQAIYMRPKNKYFDKFLRSTRGRFGCESIPMENIYSKLMDDKKNGHIATTLMLADQSPHKDNIKYWKTFLNQETPCFVGPDTLAKRAGLAMVYVHITKTRRNRYKYCFKLISKDHSTIKRNGLVDMYLEALEENIKEKPEMWLWSHRRWKHKPEDFKKQ